MKGQRIWAKHLGIPKNHYGHASSLISHGDLLYVQYDQTEDSQLLALDLASGNLAWQVTRGAVSWSSPILVENKGRIELVLTNSKAVGSYDPRDGKRLWHVQCLAGEVAPSAAYAEGVVFVATDGAVASAMDIGTHGSEPKLLWQWDEALPDAASPLASKDYLILPTGFGVVSCLDAKTGKLLWEQEFDNGFYSSPILVNDRVYITDLSGTTQIFRMGDKFERLGASSIGEDAYATPAFVGDRIYIRGVTHLFCVEEQKDEG
jgi:outer membrane protein assembly factor BamB